MFTKVVNGAESLVKLGGVRFMRAINARPDLVYIGPGSKWASPFRAGRDGDAIECMVKYLDWIEDHQDLPWAELTGKKLVCFCVPDLCHGLVLAHLADWEPGRGPNDMPFFELRCPDCHKGHHCILNMVIRCCGKAFRLIEFEGTIRRSRILSTAHVKEMWESARLGQDGFDADEWFIGTGKEAGQFITTAPTTRFSTAWNNWEPL